MRTLLLFLFLSFGSLYANEQNLGYSPFEEANALYKQEKYKAALERYTYIYTDMKKQSAPLFYNMANCHYKLQNNAKAIYFYKKALWLNPLLKAAETNLYLAQKRTIDHFKDKKIVGFAATMNSFSFKMHYDQWAWLSVGFSALLFICFLVYYFATNSLVKRSFFSLQFVTALAIATCIVAVLWQKDKLNNNKTAVVFATETAVRAEANSTSKSTTELHEGSVVYIEKTAGEWSLVNWDINQKGWVLSKTIKAVVED